MTSKEALSIIKHIDIDGRYPYPNFLKDDVRYKESIEVIEKRLNELEARDKPMKLKTKRVKVSIDDYRIDDYCPTCDEELYTTSNYCPHCGQRLDWSE